MNKYEIKIFVDITGAYPCYERPRTMTIEMSKDFLQKKFNKIIKV